MKMDLLSTTDEDVSITKEFCVRSFHWFGTHITKPELLDQWWAPKTLTSEQRLWTLEWGRRFYAMVMPDGAERWSSEIQFHYSKSNFKFFNAFADRNENPELARSRWTEFQRAGRNEQRSYFYLQRSLERLEKMSKMGFKEGTMCNSHTGNLLAKLRPEKESK